jgi:hypothetical protein
MKKPYLKIDTKDGNTILAKRILTAAGQMTTFDLVLKKETRINLGDLVQIQPLTEEEFLKWKEISTLRSLSKNPIVFDDDEKIFLQQILDKYLTEARTVLLRADSASEPSHVLGRLDREFYEKQQFISTSILAKIK